MSGAHGVMGASCTDFNRQLQSCMDPVVEQFQHHYIRFHSLHRTLHAPSSLRQECLPENLTPCPTPRDTTPANGSSFLRADNTSPNVHCGKDDSLSMDIENAIRKCFAVHCDEEIRTGNARDSANGCGFSRDCLRHKAEDVPLRMR